MKTKPNRIEERFLLKEPLFVSTKLALLLPLLLATSCDSSQTAPSMRSDVQHSTPSSPPTALPPIDKFSTTLEDEVRDAGTDRIRWSTYWKLCWDEYPGAIAYELQTITAEGSSPKLRRQPSECLRVEMVAGENKRSQGLLRREQMLGLQAGQLAYRVRAVLGDNRVTEWSQSMAIGKATTVNAQTKR